MELEVIENTLARANLALQPSIYSKIYDFLQNEMGLTSTFTDYDVFSALAIVGQVLKVKPVDDSEDVESGIHIETVMRHLGSLSKEALLEQVMKKCQKWREAPLWLKTKIEAVNMTYRIYKKYRGLFQKLGSKVGNYQSQSLYNIISIFWIVYLYVKNKSPQIDNALEVTKLLRSLFIFVFQEVITTDMTQLQIIQEFQKDFGECEASPVKVHENYREKMMNQLQNAFQYREQDNQRKLDLHKLVTDDIFLMRLADDIGNLYDKFKITLPPHTVDEISFLEVDKTLTPLSIRRNIMNSPGIMKRINFQEDDNDDNDDQDQNEPMEAEHEAQMRSEDLWLTKNKSGSFSRRVIPVSPFRPPSVHLSKHGREAPLTPLSARNQNLSWVNRITQSCEKENMEQIRYIYEKYQGNNYETFKNKTINNIKASINQFTPSCMDRLKRQRTIYSFFAYFIRKVHEKHLESEREVIFGNSGTFESILCLSTNILNYAYQSLQSSFRQYCSIFGVTLIEGQIPINWFGLYGQVTKNIESYLYDLQKKIMIQQLWEGDEGYKLLLQNGKYYKQNAILKRLRRHVDQRSSQLCDAMKIDLKQKTYVMNLMRFILDKRPGLLRDHKIDQIVVCSITSVLNINRPKMEKMVPLQEIVSHYNKLVYSWNINKSIFYDQEGNELNLLEYYNNVFLEQIDQIISNEEQAQNILNTPVRLERKTSTDKGIQMTPISIKFKQTPNEAFGSKKFKADITDGNSYRHKYASNYSRLANTLKKLDINDPIAQKEQAVQDDEHPSPSFGGKNAILFRTYSFGDFGDQC